MKQTKEQTGTLSLNPSLEGIYQKLGLLLVSGMHVRELTPGVFTIRTADANCGRKRLGLVAITHGDETIGLSIIENYLAAMLNGAHDPQVEIVVILNNIPAFRERKKFLEKDLNHLYADRKMAGASTEEQRAREIIPVLRICDYVIDFHQNMLPSRSPFVVLPNHEKGVAFARAIDPDLNMIVLPANSAGKTISDFMAQMGKAGIMAEVGGKGISANQVEWGMHMISRAIQHIVETSTEKGRNQAQLVELHFMFSRQPVQAQVRREAKDILYLRPVAAEADYERSNVA